MFSGATPRLKSERQTGEIRFPFNNRQLFFFLVLALSTTFFQVQGKDNRGESNDKFSTVFLISGCITGIR